VKLRQLVLAHKELAGKLDQLERKVGSHDEAIKQLVAAIRQLMAPPDPPKNRIGFQTIRDVLRFGRHVRGWVPRWHRATRATVPPVREATITFSQFAVGC
jgi:hypothetical protein